MSSPCELQCRCGQVKATLEHQDRLLLACYCEHCRRFAQMKGEGAALAPGGGVEMMQSTIDRLAITDGQDKLSALQFSPNAPLRWYARCCDAPLWLSLPNPNIGHLSVPATCAVDRADFGPVKAHVNIGSATGPVQKDGTMALPVVIIGMIWRIVRARFRGAARRSALYDAATKRPVVEPTLVPAYESASREV